MTRFFGMTSARRAGVVGVITGVLVAGYFVVSALAASGIPVPVITGYPPNPVTSSSATFTFTDSQAGVKFKCSLDSGPFAACTSGISYNGLDQGNHAFRVEAVSQSSTSSVASYTWAIVPPTPVIATHPANPTAAATATFTYTDSQRDVGFKCSLDGSSFATCPSTGQSYSKLADGTHTFAVEAQVGSKPPSLPASYTWRVDTTAPTITVTFPAGDGAYNAADWSSGCTSVTAGICGTASDPSGVSSAAVGIYQQSSKKYWNGSSFSSSSLVFNAASGTTAWHYGFTPPTDGGYIVYVRATDRLGNTTKTANLATAGFIYDTAPPAAPVITSGPANPSTTTSPEFQFTNTSWPNVTFTCWLDSGTHMACTGDTDGDGNAAVEGERQFQGLAPGPHCFSVYATDEAGNVGPTTKSCWTTSGGTQNFGVGGVLTSPLYPGTSQSLNLTFTNPNSSPITIPNGGISASNIAITSNTPGCASTNFAVTQGLTTAVTVPAGQLTPESLSALGVPEADWPVIKMIETNTNQDACQGASLTLTYSGIEASG
jgi:hypothetical protein